jgi:hypothetical protein
VTEKLIEQYVPRSLRPLAYAVATLVWFVVILVAVPFVVYLVAVLAFVLGHPEIHQ